MSTGYYRSFADFQREMIHPGRRVGQSIEDILDPDVFQREFELDRDPFLDDEEEEDDDDY